MSVVQDHSSTPRPSTPRASIPRACTVDGASDLARWTEVLEEFDRSLNAEPGTPKFFFPLDTPLGDGSGQGLGPLPEELRPWATELIGRSSVRMDEIRAEMERVGEEISALGRHARAASRNGWSVAGGGADRSSSGMAQAL